MSRGPRKASPVIRRFQAEAIWAILFAVAAFAIVAPAVSAQGIQPIDQAGWVALKQTAILPNGQTIAYVDLGAKDAPPVALIHGFTDNSRSWSLIAPMLARRYRLIIVDLRGHGASGAPECCYALTDLAYDVRLLLDHLGIARADLVGHSLGSMAAQVFAQSWPDRVGRLALISSTVSPAAVAGPGGWLWTNIMALTAPIDPDSKFMLDWYANPHPVDPVFLAAERRESAQVPLAVWRGVDAEMAKADFGGLSHLITAPVLIIWGRQDSLFGSADQAKLRRALPRARFVAFETGHNVMWEQPEKVAQTLLDFLGAGAAADDFQKPQPARPGADAARPQTPLRP